MGGFVKPIAHSQVLSAINQLSDKVSVNALLHDDAARSGAALACSAECAPQRPFNRQVEVCIIEHDHRVFAAEFERAMLETFRCSRADGLADRARSGKGNGPHIWMLKQRT